ncbi:type II toxin-antitoxin system VapC family toxin [Miniimonas arenae]|uniref:Type II toxin-antitoxin system VapC family toxin n=1 Tax=Miniimonas arenae TaxID=676201 RepID=A0A5C5B9T0_9MICO|nr:type II toxin-antitoxin system VapC family toxin [Miniimonas arenae]TNU73279.1 type II toxin-antitoxin system VapC family toxin [Miniimonas arenae]
MTVVLDASAVLAFLGDEAGGGVVERALDEGARCSAVNWSEVAQKVSAAGGDWDVAAALLASYGLAVEDASAADGVEAARLWKRGSGLSLADRFCLALGARLGETVLTADSAWGSGEAVRQIR